MFRHALYRRLGQLPLFFVCVGFCVVVTVHDPQELTRMNEPGDGCSRFYRVGPRRPTCLQ